MKINKKQTKTFRQYLKEQKLKEGKVSDKDKIKALADFLGVGVYITHIKQISNDMFRIDGSEDSFQNGSKWMVLTDEEADEQTKKHIKEKIWTFDDWFIKNHMSDERIEELENKNIDIDELIVRYQSLKKGGNDAIIDLIGDFDEFVENVIAEDGRGHFLSRNGEEGIQRGGVQDFYVYKK